MIERHRDTIAARHVRRSGRDGDLLAVRVVAKIPCLGEGDHSCVIIRSFLQQRAVPVHRCGVVGGAVVSDLEGGTMPRVGGTPMDVEDELLVVGHLDGVSALGLVEEIK